MPSTSASQYGAIIETARAAPAHAVQPIEVPPALAPQVATPAAPAQHSLALETRAPSGNNTPQAVLAASATTEKTLQQVETQTALPIGDAMDGSRNDRPRRRRRPTTSTPAAETVLQQVETTTMAAPVVSDDTATPHPTRRRQRPSSPVVNEPLIQVETGRQP